MNFSDALKAATLDIFSTMLSLPVDVESEQATAPEGDMRFDVSGIIGLAGACQGSVAIHMNKALAIKITAAMLGMEIDDITPEVEDCVGEVANMVTGGAKTALATEGIDFDLSLPTVVIGEGHSTNQIDDGGQSGVIMFASEAEKLVVEYMIKQD